MSDIHPRSPSSSLSATRIYSGRNQEVFVRDSQGSRPLRPYADHGEGTQNLFAWGHNSEAGKRLAAALLTDALENDNRAAELADIFNARVISILPERWSMTRERVLSYTELMRRQLFEESLSTVNSSRNFKSSRSTKVD